MTHQKLNKMGNPNLKISFHSSGNHLPLSLLFPFGVSVLLRLGPLSCPKEDDSQRKQKAEARNRCRTDSRLWGKEMSPQLLMPILFCWPQLDDMDWFKLLLSLLAAWLWRDRGGLEKPTQDKIAAFVLRSSHLSFDIQLVQTLRQAQG